MSNVCVCQSAEERWTELADAQARCEAAENESSAKLSQSKGIKHEILRPKQHTPSSLFVFAR